MSKRIIVAVLSLWMAMAPIVWAQEAVTNMTSLEKMAVVEKLIYGSESSGSLLERLIKVENDVYGSPSKTAMFSRVDKLYAYVRESSTGLPSMQLKTAAVEWALNHTVSPRPIKERIESLEKAIVGSSINSISLDVRLNKLLVLTFPGGKIEAAAITLSKDTLIKIKTVAELDTKKTRAGDLVEFQAADDVYAGGLLVIAKGAPGRGKVLKAEQAQNFGRDAKLEVSFDSIEAVDAKTIDAYIGEKAKEETQSLAKAAAVVGLILLGPIGVVGSAFVHGKNIVVPAGTELYIQTKSDMDVVGIKVK